MTEALDVAWRWPWQTREDVVIRLLDDAISDAAKERAAADEVTRTVTDETHRRADG